MDLDKDKIKKANEIAVEAIERIRSEDLVPTPEIYHLWYAYYASMSLDVVRAVDLLLASDQKIDNAACMELYQRFLSDKNETDTVREAGEKVQETIKDVSGMFEDIRERTEQYGDNLTKMTGDLSEESDPVQVKNVLTNVLSDTKDMLDQNKKLEDELSKSSVAMEALKQDLETVRKEALTDALTQISNRKAFDMEIERIHHIANENDMTFSLVFLDIDHFKPFNDKYGHQVGDQVLRLVGRTLTDGVKGKDMAARYGGEEFVLILPDTTLIGASKVAESLLVAVASKDVINRNTGTKLGKITLSAGVAEYVPGEETEDIIRRADTALYEAKRQGRNRVICASDKDAKKTGS